MQREAEQRVREMQSRARLLGETEKFIPSPPCNPIHRNKNITEPIFQNPVSSFLGGIDNDKLVVLALLWILWNEHADNKLLLALLYLLL